MRTSSRAAYKLVVLFGASSLLSLPNVCHAVEIRKMNIGKPSSTPRASNGARFIFFIARYLRILSFEAMRLFGKEEWSVSRAGTTFPKIVM